MAISQEVSLKSLSIPSVVEGFTYDAFISYRNAPAYSSLARAVQRGLHGFARPWNRLRAMRTYRDETNVRASANLWAEIETALRASRCFVLLASPEAVESPWVRKELEWWLTERGSKGLFLCLVGGSIEFKSDSLTIDTNRTNSLPADIVGKLPSAPFYVDLRVNANDPARQSMTDENFRAGVQKLSAAILARPLDELAGEDIRQQRIRTRIRNGAIVALSVLVVVSVLFGVLAYNASQESRRQAQFALLGQGRALASASALAAELGDGTIAALYAATGNSQLNLVEPVTGNENALPSKRTARRQTDFSLFSAQSLPFLLASFDLPPRSLPVLDFDSRRRRLYVADEGSGIKVLEPMKRPVWTDLEPLNGNSVAGIAADGLTGKVAAVTPSGLLVVDPAKPEMVPTIITKRSSFRAVVFAPQSGDLLAGLTIFRAGEKWKSIQVTDDLGAPASATDILRLVTAGDAEIALVVSRRGPSALVDLRKAQVVARFGGEDETLTVDGALTADGTLVALRDLNGKITVYRAATGKLIWQAQASSGVGGISFSKEGLLAVASAGEIQLIDASFGSRRHRFKTGRPEDVAMLLRFSSQGDSLLAAWQSGHYEYFRFRIPSEVRNIVRITKDTVEGLTPDVAGRWALGWTKEGLVSAFKLGSDEPVLRHWQIKDELSAAVPDNGEGKWILVAASGTVYRLSVGSSEPVQVVPRSDGVRMVAGSVSDGSWAVATGDGKVAVSTGAEVQGPTDFSTLLLHGSAGLIAILSEEAVKVWNYAAPGVPLLVDRRIPNALTAAFSRDGRQIAIGALNGDVHIYRLDGTNAATIAHPHVALVSDLMFNESGELLVSASFDGTKVLIEARTGDTMLFEGNHGTEAQHLAISEELGLVASAGEDGGVLLNGLHQGGLIRQIPVGNSRVSEMFFSNDSLVFGTDDGNLRIVELNTLDPESLDLLRLRIGRNLSSDERNAFGLSRGGEMTPEKEKCYQALERTDNPYATMSGVVMDERQFRGQADICRRAAELYPREACWSRMAGAILRRHALALETLGKTVEALGAREEAYALTRTAAEKGCTDAVLDLVELGRGRSATVGWARAQLERAAAGGSEKAAVELFQLTWDETKTREERQKVLQGLRNFGAGSRPWALAKRAALLAEEGLDLHAEQVFRDSARASFLFESCDISDAASNQAASLRALALLNLEEAAAIAAVKEERAAVDNLLGKETCSQLK